MDAIIYALITGVAFNYAVWHIGREVRQARVGEFSGCAHPKGVFFFTGGAGNIPSILPPEADSTSCLPAMKKQIVC